MSRVSKIWRKANRPLISMDTNLGVSVYLAWNAILIVGAIVFFGVVAVATPGSLVGDLLLGIFLWLILIELMERSCGGYLKHTRKDRE